MGCWEKRCSAEHIYHLYSDIANSFEKQDLKKACEKTFSDGGTTWKA